MDWLLEKSIKPHWLKKWQFDSWKLNLKACINRPFYRYGGHFEFYRFRYLLWDTQVANTYMLFAGWEVRMVKSCDRGLENAARGRGPRAAFSSPRSQFFTIRTDLKPANDMFFFSCSKLALKITEGFVYAALIIHWACAPSTNDL